jgi:hypothetical protein
VTSEVPSGHAREMAQESSKKKVQYHPHGDRDYPSPLHTVVVDNVTLPAVSLNVFPPLHLKAGSVKVTDS